MLSLYVKCCKHCGLKYFGKTECYDPFVYTGSGKYWKRHINKHGKHFIETLSVFSFNDVEEGRAFAIEFSKENLIVESNEWANERPENGIDGWPKGVERGPMPHQLGSKKRGIPKGYKFDPSAAKRLGRKRGYKFDPEVAKRLGRKKGYKCSPETVERMIKARRVRELSV